MSEDDDWYTDEELSELRGKVESLEAENARLRAEFIDANSRAAIQLLQMGMALQAIADHDGAPNDDAEPCREIARAVLSSHQDTKP